MVCIIHRRFNLFSNMPCTIITFSYDSYQFMSIKAGAFTCSEGIQLQTSSGFQSPRSRLSFLSKEVDYSWVPKIEMACYVQMFEFYAMTILTGTFKHQTK